jgi:hypothetical protein
MHWLTTYGLGSHLVGWLALAVVVVLTFAARLGARRFIIGLLTRKHDKGKGEREYWRRHGGLGRDPIELTSFLAELRCAQVVTAGRSGELSDSVKIGRPPTTGPRFRSAALQWRTARLRKFHTSRHP